MIISTDSFISVINKIISQVAAQFVEPNCSIGFWLISNFSKLINLIDEFKMAIDCVDICSQDAFNNISLTCNKIMINNNTNINQNL